MKRVLLLTLIVILFSAAFTQAAHAQAETPSTPTGPLGEIRGSVINRNSGKAVTESLEVMLHVLDLNYVDQDMVHGQSQADGTFVFADVPFDASLQFAVMATFNGVTYYSDVIPADMQSLEVDLDVPVYETTKDLSKVQVDRMHVLFDVSPDGLETREVYVLSNLGERTVKDVYDLGNDQSATLEFPLPQDADYIFFQPEDKDRFIKQTNGFADTYPMVPGAQSVQITVSYLVPYSGEKTYNYTAPVNVARMNFLVPASAQISVTGAGLSESEPTTLRDNKSYMVYTYSNLQAGQTLNINLAGAAATHNATQSNANNRLAAGAAFLGLGVLGAGIWWWRKPAQGEDETIPPANEPTLDDLITEIALLDETHEEKGLSLEEYQNQRKALLQKAKSLS